MISIVSLYGKECSLHNLMLFFTVCTDCMVAGKIYENNVSFSHKINGLSGTGSYHICKVDEKAMMRKYIRSTHPTPEEHIVFKCQK